MGRPRRIVALGGHEFRLRSPELAILQHVLELTGAESPRVCLLPTAAGDSRDGIADFYASADRFDCLPTHVSLFRLERERVDLRRHLLEQDMIYVAGGSLVNLLAIWRAHRLPVLLAEAWRSGVILCGQSAGALCWFDHAITSSAGRPLPVRGLGLVRGSLCVHYARDPARRVAYRCAVADGLPGGWGIDDGAGIVFESGKDPVPLAGRERARVIGSPRSTARRSRSSRTRGCLPTGRPARRTRRLARAPSCAARPHASRSAQHSRAFADKRV